MYIISMVMSVVVKKGSQRVSLQCCKRQEVNWHGRNALLDGRLEISGEGVKVNLRAVGVGFSILSK